MLSPWVESTSRGRQFCSGCQEGSHRLMDFSALMFSFSLLLIVWKTKSSYQQGLLDGNSLPPPSQSPNSCLVASLVLCQEDEVVLGTASWNFILWTNWCLDLPPTPPITLRCRPAVPSSSTLWHEQVLWVDACFGTWETFQLGGEVGKHGLSLVLPSPNICSGRTTQGKLKLHLEKGFNGGEGEERQGRAWWGARLVA